MPLAHLGTLDVLHDAAAPPRPVLVLDERLACTWDPYQSMPELRLIQEEEKEEEEEEEDEEEATVKMRRKANRPLRDCIYIYISHITYIVSKYTSATCGTRDSGSAWEALRDLVDDLNSSVSFFSSFCTSLVFWASQHFLEPTTPQRYGCMSFGRNDPLLEAGNFLRLFVGSVFISGFAYFQC